MSERKSGKDGKGWLLAIMAVVLLVTGSVMHKCIIVERN